MKIHFASCRIFMGCMPIIADNANITERNCHVEEFQKDLLIKQYLYSVSQHRSNFPWKWMETSLKLQFPITSNM